MTSLFGKSFASALEEIAYSKGISKKDLLGIFISAIKKVNNLPNNAIVIINSKGLFLRQLSHIDKIWEGVLLKMVESWH